LRGKRHKVGTEVKCIIIGSEQGIGIVFAAARLISMSGQIDLWLFRPEPDIADDALRVLDQQERDRAAKFSRSTDRDHFVTTRAALRCLLARATGERPGEIRFVCDFFGKPNARYRTCKSGPHFSTSHAQGMCAIAISSSDPVGVDIERRREIRERRWIAGNIFGNEVSAGLAGVPLSQENDAFLRLWTAAEAFVKATGRGFAGTDGRIPISLATDGSPRLNDRQPCAAEWRLSEIENLGDYTGSIVVRKSGAENRCRSRMTNFRTLTLDAVVD
jgi:4'-phosphopantetheinyl transferase